MIESPLPSTASFGTGTGARTNMGGRNHECGSERATRNAVQEDETVPASGGFRVDSLCSPSTYSGHPRLFWVLCRSHVQNQQRAAMKTFAILVLSIVRDKRHSEPQETCERNK